MSRSNDERRQREHELSGSLDAARTLQARLELCGDRALDGSAVTYVQEHESSGDWLADAARVDEIERTAP